MCSGTALTNPSIFSKPQGVSERILLVVESPKVEEPFKGFTTDGEMTAVLDEYLNDPSRESFRSVSFFACNDERLLNRIVNLGNR